MEPYLAVDSWLVEEGRARGMDLHRARFAGAVAGAGAAGRGAADVRRFLDAAVAALPRSGRWFPRVELVPGTTGAGELRLWVRPAPPRRDGVCVAALAHPDGRRSPTVKGPDLVWQAGLRATTGTPDEGEVLLALPDGTVGEGVWTSVLWWDGETLCALPAGAPVLGSVTRALVLQLAGVAGVRVERRAPTLAHLRAAETWLVNALHGIRPVTAWLAVPGAAPEPAPVIAGRAVAWQARLEGLAVTLS